MLSTFVTGSAVPERAVLKVGATYSVNSSDMLQPMETHLTTLMENNPCVQSGDCNVSISVNQVSEGNRVRRDTNNAFQGLLVVTATTLHIDYFPNNTLDVYAGNLFIVSRKYYKHQPICRHGNGYLLSNNKRLLV